MTCGILLVTHPGVGTALLDVATRLLRQLPLKTEAFEVPFDADLDALLPLASAALRRVDGGDGVLILTDLYGASPANLAGQLARLGTPVRRVSALSLPMLLRVMNYPEQGLDQLPATAAAGTRNGAIVDDAERELTVSNRLGLHARATAKLVQTLAPFRCNVTMAAKGREINAKSIMGVMLLAAGQGTPVTVRINGEDEAAAMEAVVGLFERRFDEDS